MKAKEGQLGRGRGLVGGGRGKRGDGGMIKVGFTRIKTSQWNPGVITVNNYCILTKIWK